MSSTLPSILHVDHESGWGGGQSQVLGLIGYQQQRGYRVLLAADSAGRLAARARDLGVAVVPLRVRFHFDPLAAVAMRRLLSRECCDIVHFHTSRTHALALWLPLSGPRLVVTRRMDYHLRGGRVIRRLYNERVHGVIAISEGVKQALVESGVSHDRISVIHSGVDLNRFCFRPQDRLRIRRGLELEEGDFMALVPAALESRKGHRFLFLALEKLLKRGLGITLVCCGRGRLRGELETVAAALRISDAVRFTGFVTDMPAMLSAADVVVLPSLQEGLGVSLLEAMAASRPVVATSVGGIPEVLLGGRAGVLVPPGDAGALAQALEEIGASRELGQHLGRVGRERVEAAFSMEAMARRTEVCYRQVLGGC